jgi:hypothetical protein
MQNVCESVVYIQKVADMQLQTFKMGLPQLSAGFRVGICWYLTQLEIILDPNKSKSAVPARQPSQAVAFLSALRGAEGGPPPVYWQAGGGDLHI